MDKKNIRKVIGMMFLQFFVSTAFFVIAMLVSEGTDAETWVIIAGFILFAVSVAAFVIGLWKSGSYICAECGGTVNPKLWGWVRAMHFVSRRRLFCPQCNKICWCQHIAYTKNDKG